MSDSATKPNKQDLERAAAIRYLGDRAYHYLLGKSQPAKLGQIIKNCGVENVSMRLMKHTLVQDSRFETIDRRWCVSSRFGDSQRPVERVLEDILKCAGIPLSVGCMSAEIAQVYGRPDESIEGMVRRMLTLRENFIDVGDEKYGLVSWLLIPTSENEEDVLFDNFVEPEDAEYFTSICPIAKWSLDNIADTAAALVADCKEPIPLKILALFAWRVLGEDFDAADFYTQIAEDDRIVILSDQKAYSANTLKEFDKTLAKIAEELADMPIEEEEEESEGPVEVTDTDKEEIISLIIKKGSASAEELLEAVLEISPEESAFASALESLREALKDDERIMWIGGTRWGKVEQFPDDIKIIPESLVVPEVQPFETPEGDVYDQMIEEDGFEGDLKAAVYDPLAEDVTDEDPSRTMYQPCDEKQRCVLKYHHKQEGTFPLCQISPDFFGKEPEIIPIVLVDEGKRKNAYVNNTTRLIYGLKDFYKDITEVSGAVFYIEKTANPGEFRFVYNNEADDKLAIDTGRSLELLDLKARYESQEMPLFDVITEILEQRRQGMTFISIVNEVNIVKRCSRLLVASILSSYHCFHTRGKSGLWQYDEKKRSQGFNKTKRKYVKK